MAMSYADSSREFVDDTPRADDSGRRQEAGDRSHLAWLAVAARGRYADPHRYLLALRFAVVNFVGFALLGVAYLHGLVDQIVAADATRLVIVIAMLFVGGLFVCGWKIAQTSHELNQVKDFNPLVPSRAAAYLAEIRGRSGDSRALIASSLRLKLSHRIGVVHNIANSLIFLGLIGTVVGFIIALSGVDPARVADVESISPMVANLIEGMSVALYTTLVGAVLHLWLMVNYRILASGTVNLLTELVELGESHAAA